MTTPEPTDADVGLLADMLRSTHRLASDEAAARHLLAAGVTLPPEPEPPQERYFVANSGMAWDHGIYDLLDPEPTSRQAVAEACNHDLAERVAALLNADEAHDGGIVAAFAKTTAGRDSWREKAINADKEAIDADTHAGGLIARVKELEGELAAAKQNYDQAWAFARGLEEDRNRLIAEKRNPRPAPRAMTAGDVRLAMADLAADAIGPFGPISHEDVAGALNARLAGNNPEGE